MLPVAAEELHLFLTRVRKALSDTNRNRPRGPLPDIILDTLGTWQLATDQRELMDCFANTIEPAEVNHAF